MSSKFIQYMRLIELMDRKPRKSIFKVRVVFNISSFDNSLTNIRFSGDNLLPGTWFHEKHLAWVSQRVLK